MSLLSAGGNRRGSLRQERPTVPAGDDREGDKEGTVSKVYGSCEGYGRRLPSIDVR